MPTLHLEHRSIPDADLQEIEAAIRSLDGARNTLVIVELSSGKTFTAGGGPTRLVAEIAENDTDRWALVDPSPARGTTDLVVGGQLVDYPARLCVDVSTVLTAIQTFVTENGTRHPNLNWSVET
jgi:hypothetical protein